MEQDCFIRCESYHFYPSDNYNISNILEESNKNERENEEEYKLGNYLIKKTLGKGTFGKVKLGIYMPTQEKVAIKILEKSRIIEKDDEIRVKREFEMLTLFSHPNVILVAEIFESAGSFYSVMEYCEGGELFNYIVRNRRLSQNEAAFFYYQLINGLEYIHSLGIVHRDLKPENLLLTKDHILKIIDFGLSNYFKTEQKNLLVTPCGSPCYASPEMVAGKKYNGFKIDIWSTGIILYAMLCGYLPFEDKDNDILFEKILECKLIFPKYISKLGKSLIEKILVIDPNKRITIKEIKKHPFYLKGKELFESEFSICHIENNMKAFNTNDDINNIMDIHILNDSKENVENINKNNNKSKRKEKAKEKKIKKEKNKSIKKEKLKLKEFENNNLILRKNTEGDEDKKALTLRKGYLPDLEKDIDEFSNKKNNRSSKKIDKKYGANKVKNKYINKANGPFKMREIIFTKNNNKKYNDKKLEEKSFRNETKNNKKLIKTTKYNNIKKLIPRKYIIGKSVDIRKINLKGRDKNLIQHKINDYTNIIKSKFNSKEKFDKNKIIKKENIYANNINNIEHKEYFNKKLKPKFNLSLYNTIEKKYKKTPSTTKNNIKLTSFQTIDTQKNYQNYLDNLFNIHSNIKKYKQQLNDLTLTNKKLKEPLKIKIRNNLNKVNKEEKSFNKKLENEIIPVEKSKRIKINKDKLKLTKLYNNTINNKNALINIIDNTAEEEIINNNSQNKSETLNTDRENTIENQTINLKTNREKLFKKKLVNLKYYLNEIEKSQTYRKEEKKKNKHIRELNTDLINSIEVKKSTNFNLKKTLINDFNKKTKKNEKENTLILNNLANNDINLNTIDNINRTEPNQIVHIKKKIRNNNKNEKTHNLSNEKKFVKRKISKKINLQKNIHLNSNNFVKKQKINFNENKIITEPNYEKNLNNTSNDFNNFKYSIVNQMNLKYRNIFESMNEERNERNAKYEAKNFINDNMENKESKKKISDINKKPCVTIKNTVINLNIDTGFIINPFDKSDKIKQINSSRPHNYFNNEINDNDNNHRYEPKYKNNNYINKERIAKNIIHHNTNENQFQTANIDKSILNEHNNIFRVNKILPQKKIADKNNLNLKNNKSNKAEKNFLNKSMNNNIKRHIKYKSMKLEENGGNKFYKKEINNLHLKTKENFF